MTRRATAVLVLGVWLAALGWLVRREFLVPAPAPLTTAELSLPPGASYYALTLGTQQVGYASTIVDTVPDTLRVTELLVLDLPVMGSRQRTEAQTEAVLSRALALRSFTATMRTPVTRYAARGTISGDTLLTVELDLAGRRDTLTLTLDGPVVLPGLVPLTVAFGGELAVGRVVTLRVFDPAILQPRPATFRIVADSTFIFPDSATFDSLSGRFRAATFDTVRAWAVQQDARGGALATQWIDAVGNVVHASTGVGFTMERSAFELAYGNFRREGVPPDAPTGDIVPQTALAAGVPLTPDRLRRLRVRLGGVALAGYDLDGGRQQLHGDTLVVTREGSARLGAEWRLGRAADSLAPWLRPAPLIQSDDARIQAQARLVIAGTGRPQRAAERLTTWVHQNVAKTVALTIPSALDVLERRRGDCNEHTVLFVAMARAVGLPARTAAGLVYLNGRFFFHAWAEVWLDDAWVAVDPTLGQFPADAAHLRFTVGELARQVELVRLLGRLTIDIVDRQD